MLQNMQSTKEVQAGRTAHLHPPYIHRTSTVRYPQPACIQRASNVQRVCSQCAASVWAASGVRWCCRTYQPLPPSTSCAARAEVNHSKFGEDRHYSTFESLAKSDLGLQWKHDCITTLSIQNSLRLRHGRHRWNLERTSPPTPASKIRHQHTHNENPFPFGFPRWVGSFSRVTERCLLRT
jgi:hypothetical protein